MIDRVLRWALAHRVGLGRAASVAGAIDTAASAGAFVGDAVEVAGAVLGTGQGAIELGVEQNLDAEAFDAETESNEEPFGFPAR